VLVPHRLAGIAAHSLRRPPLGVLREPHRSRYSSLYIPQSAFRCEPTKARFWRKAGDAGPAARLRYPKQWRANEQDSRHHAPLRRLSARRLNARPGPTRAALHRRARRRLTASSWRLGSVKARCARNRPAKCWHHEQSRSVAAQRIDRALPSRITHTCLRTVQGWASSAGLPTPGPRPSDKSLTARRRTRPLTRTARRAPACSVRDQPEARTPGLDQALNLTPGPERFTCMCVLCTRLKRKVNWPWTRHIGALARSRESLSRSSTRSAAAESESGPWSNWSTSARSARSASHGPSSRSWPTPSAIAAGPRPSPSRS